MHIGRPVASLSMLYLEPFNEMNSRMKCNSYHQILNDGGKVPIKSTNSIFIDENGIIRCKSRYEAWKYPMLLQARNSFSRLLLIEAHGLFIMGLGEL